MQLTSDDLSSCNPLIAVWSCHEAAPSCPFALNAVKYRTVTFSTM